MNKEKYKIIVKRTEITREKYEIQYFYKRHRIAFYNSQTDTLYLETDFILNDNTKSLYYRALNGIDKKIFNQLFKMLNINKNSKLSENKQTTRS